MDDFSLGFSPDSGSGWDQSYTPPDIAPDLMQGGGQAGGGWLNNMLGGFGGGQQQPGSQGGNLGGLMQLLGLGLGGGGMLASLLGGGGSQTQTPKMSGQQIDTINNLKGLLTAQQPTQQALYQQGAGMLGDMGRGQIPAGLQQLVQQAYQPALQNLGTNAIEASQRAGFALPQDAMQGGPGLRIMGQGLAQMPGQMAQTTLNTMFPLINALMGQGQQGVSNMQGAFNSLPGGQTQQQNPGLAQRAAGAAPWLAGMGNIMNPPQDQTSNFMRLMLQNQMGPQGGIPVAGQQQGQQPDMSIPNYQLY